jgi:hypothetical protein
MRRIREYEIWNRPGRITVDPDPIVAEIANELGLSSETIIPHHEVPDSVHCENLKIALAERELSYDDLAKFCSASGYPVSPDDPTVAYHFLNHSYGQTLAWIHLDEKDAHDVERSRIYMAAWRRGLALVDAHNLLCLALFDKESFAMKTRELLAAWNFPHIEQYGVTLVARADAEKCLMLILERKCRLHGYDGFTLFDDGRIQPHTEWSASWSWDQLPKLDEMLRELREPPSTVTHFEFVFSDGV